MSDDKKQKRRFPNIEEKHRCHQNIQNVIIVLLFTCS